VRIPRSNDFPFSTGRATDDERADERADDENA
jgi:hypothetical protein